MLKSLEILLCVEVVRRISVVFTVLAICYQYKYRVKVTSLVVHLDDMYLHVFITFWFYYKRRLLLQIYLQPDSLQSLVNLRPGYQYLQGLTDFFTY